MARSRSFKLELNRLIATAGVNRAFCKTRLTDPAQALDGYAHEKFEFTPDERKQILAIRAGTLQEFAYEVVKLTYKTSSQHPE